MGDAAFKLKTLPTFPEPDPKRPYVIYLIAHKDNGKKYVGYTTNLPGRVRSHWYSPNWKMEGDVTKAKAAKQTFSETFEVTILRRAFNKEHAEYAEKHYAEKHRSAEPGNCGFLAGASYRPGNYEKLQRMKNFEARSKRRKVYDEQANLEDTEE